jgi:hypothetical protein
VTKFRGNPWAVLLVVSLGFFMTLLDLTIVNIAIPNLISKLVQRLTQDKEPLVPFSPSWGSAP